MMSETWKSVVGLEGKYDVSDHGRVRSWKKLFSNERATEPKVLSPGHDTNEYLIVCLDGKTCQVHVLVLEAFVGPRPGHWRVWQGCHGDGDKENVRLDNLRWDTTKANNDDRIRHGWRQDGAHNPNATLTADQAAQIKIRLQNVKHGDVTRIAKEFGVTQAIVSKIKNGIRWKE